MDLNQTIGGTRLTLFANLPKGQKVTTYARFEADLSHQPKPQQRPSTARSAAQRHGGTVSAPRPKPSSLPGTPRAPGSNQAKAPMPRTMSAPKPLAKAARPPAAARLPRVASQGKAPVHSRPVVSPRVRKNSFSVLDAPRLRRQRTGETTADSPEPPMVASPPPPTVASPLPDRRSGLSDDMGAVFVRSPLAPSPLAPVATVAPRALRPPPAPCSVEPPKTQGAEQPPARRTAMAPAVVAPAQASAQAVLPRACAPARVSPRAAPPGEAGRPTRLASLRAQAAAGAAAAAEKAEENAQEKAQTTAAAAAGCARVVHPVVLRREAAPATQPGGSRREASAQVPCQASAQVPCQASAQVRCQASAQTSSRPRVRAWHEVATAP